MALGSTQPLTEVSNRNLPGGGGGKERPARKAGNLIAICEQTVFNSSPGHISFFVRYIFAIIV
jgi:hypothetical protein